MSAKANKYVIDNDSPVVLTNMIHNKKEFKTHPVFSETDFEKSKDYFHIQPHEESHTVRRRAIMAKYGKQIEALMTKDYRSALVALLIVCIQLPLAYYCSQMSWLPYLAILYIVGGTLNHTAQILVHDLTHYTAFQDMTLNRLAAIMVCVPTGLPSAITFGKYHWEHHVNMGNPDYDADLPTPIEIALFKTPLAKLFFVFCHPLFYVFRPLFTKPKKITAWEGFNWLCILTTDFLIYKYLGVWALVYLLGSTWFSMGLHPAAAHTIGEHYEFVKGQESYNYYGIWNFFNINLGYHIEHHDFPFIPCWRLPEVSKIAPEFYENIPFHTSYCAVIWNYIMDKNIGAYSRIDISGEKAKKAQ